MGRFNKHIIVVGSARSGTSWLSETIAKQHRYRMLFEPEHSTRTKHGPLICDRLITAPNGFKKATNYLKRVFANRVDSDWIAQNSNRKYKRHLWPFVPKKFVIKFVRCNLSAQFMHDYFEIPVVQIIRNPYDVLLSQQRVKFPWLYDMDRFKSQTELVDLVKHTYNFDLNTIDTYTDLEKLALRWCLENVVPLEHLYKKSDTFRVVKHEDLRADIKVYLQLCKDFNLEPISAIKKEYSKPSTKTHPKSTVRGANEALGFTGEEYLQINAIFDIFGMSLYPKQFLREA